MNKPTKMHDEYPRTFVNHEQTVMVEAWDVAGFMLVYTRPTANHEWSGPATCHTEETDAR